ncbi:Predicted Zn-dependent peptidase [Pseudarcicella hirudinis]|uniref:Predicted Zn-dependent peptidase n=1 Tax=Pseudarcicella hirudinis TaxID=1079859 RepID=A0A1I5QIG3_9BACT|nr:pitrilysin family protein [Pseudarcicella hirudinis]SFP46049.1 Predicted Zn-dependent peptidase [Pseudarcicella hirudinis]
MILDRTISPNFKTIDEVNIASIQTIVLANGIPLHIVNVGEQPVMKLEVSFEAGGWFDYPNNGVSHFTAKMLSEGTANHSSSKISEFFDLFGAFTEFGHGLDRANVVVYGLTKHLSSLLPMILEIINESVFPQRELDNLKNISLQTLKVNLEKNAFVANQVFRKDVFGAQHPYGNSLRAEDIQSINRDDLIKFYNNRWKNQPCRIFLSGKISDAEIKLIETFFGNHQIAKSDISSKVLPETDYNSQDKILVEKENAVQSSIRMGRKLFKRSHPDYFKMLLLNETLGGYFGSRLMKNIREEKGFTYGISSNVAPFARDGYFIIGTDVKKEFTQQTIDEIYKEIKKLQTELVSESELETVKNYMIGAFAGSLNTPFEIIDRYKVILGEDLPLDFYQNYISNIRQVSAPEILEMANQYLSEGSLLEVVVGGK